MSDVTRILSLLPDGDRGASEQLIPLVYDELRKLAAAQLAREPAGQTLQATALVHDAFIRLVDGDHRQRWDSRGHFFAAASEAMRRLLVESARRKRTLKRGGSLVRQPLNEDAISAPEIKHDLLALDTALDALSSVDPQAATLVKLRYFSGLTIDESSRALGVSRRTAERLWTWSKAWLLQYMLRDADNEPT